MSIYKNSMAAKQYIKPLGSTTLTAGPDTLLTLNLLTFGQIRKAAVVIAGASITGNTTVTWYGSDATSGGNLTKIAQITLVSGDNEGVVQIDGEDISEAAEVAGLLPDGFLSLQCKVDGTESDTIKSTVVVEPLHERVGLTPSDKTVLT